MRRIGVSASPTLTDRIDEIRNIVNTIQESGSETLLENETAQMLGTDGMRLEDMDGLDILVTIGGDGTVLRALQHSDAPILGVNMGRVGFLNEVQPEKFKEDLSRVLDGEFIIDDHTRICMCIDGKTTLPVLNEVVIHSSQAVKMREFNIYIDGDKLDHYRSDGIIIATPTGSTGYAMSAGGPLMDPRLKGILLLPLAPFRVAKRPNVVPLDTVIKIEIAKQRPCIANLDGQKEIALTGKEDITFTNADSPARFLRFESNPHRVRQRVFEALNQY